MVRGANLQVGTGAGVVVENTYGFRDHVIWNPHETLKDCYQVRRETQPPPRPFSAPSRSAERALEMPWRGCGSPSPTDASPCFGSDIASGRAWHGSGSCASRARG